MDILSILNNNWFVSIASTILGLLILPLVNGISSFFGHFTGKYIAITFQPDGQNILLEYIKLRHTRHKVYGNIYGVCFAYRRDFGLMASHVNSAKYKLDGFVDERLLILSYSTTTRSVKSSGTLTLQGDSVGTTFDGVWSGFADDQIISGRCIWFKIRGNISATKDTHMFLLLANRALNRYGVLPNISNTKPKLSAARKPDAWIGRRKANIFDDLFRSRSEPYLYYVEGASGLGKTDLMKALQEKRMESHISQSSDESQISSSGKAQPTMKKPAKKPKKKP